MEGPEESGSGSGNVRVCCRFLPVNEREKREVRRTVNQLDTNPD